MIVVVTYLIYLIISIAITVWVARTLSKNGLIFLVDGFNGNEELANSVNHMLVVGFYLVNFGFVNLALRFGFKPVDAQTSIEYLSTKVGLVLLVLGLMHLFNVKAISGFRTRTRRETRREQELKLAMQRQANEEAAADTAE